VKHALKSSTIKWLIFFATLLSTMLMNQDLLVDLVGEKGVKWMELVSVIVGAIVPAKARLDTEKKAMPLINRPQPKLIEMLVDFFAKELLAWINRKMR